MTIKKVMEGLPINDLADRALKRQIITRYYKDITSNIKDMRIE